MQKSKKQTVNYPRILIILTAIVSIVAISLSTYALVRVSNSEKLTNTYISELQYNTARIRFCHDNQITPCDDMPIQKWNSEHSPDERFNL